MSLLGSLRRVRAAQETLAETQALVKVARSAITSRGDDPLVQLYVAGGLAAGTILARRRGRAQVIKAVRLYLEALAASLPPDDRQKEDENG